MDDSSLRVPGDLVQNFSWADDVWAKTVPTMLPGDLFIRGLEHAW